MINIKLLILLKTIIMKNILVIALKQMYEIIKTFYINVLLSSVLTCCVLHSPDSETVDNNQ